MALKWIDKVDGVDEILSEDINSIANAVVDLQEDFKEFEENDVNLSDYYTKSEVDEKLGQVKDVDQTYNPESENAQSGKAVYEAVTNKEQYIFSVIRENYATKEEVGNIEIVLDNIIATQNTLIGGDSE